MAAKINNIAFATSHFSSHDLPKMASQEKSGSKATTNFKNLNFNKSLYQDYLRAKLYAVLHTKATVEAIWVFIDTHATKVMARVYQATTSSYN